MDKRTDLAVALGFAALGLTIILAAMQIKQGMMRDPVGPRLAFYLCGGTMLAGGLWITLRHLYGMMSGGSLTAPAEGTPDEPGHPASRWPALGLLLLALAYAGLFQPLGYLLATPAFILAALWLTGERAWGRNILIAVVFTVVTWATFALGLGVRMPVGPFHDLFRSLGWVRL
jgi:putative tricarboxylic transport membrane protein